MQESTMITTAVMVVVISLTCANNTPVLRSGNSVFAKDVHPSTYDFKRTAPKSLTQHVFPQLIVTGPGKSVVTKETDDQEQGKGKSHDLTESHIPEVLTAKDRNLHRPGQSVDHPSVLYHQLMQLNDALYDLSRQAFLTKTVETHRDATVKAILRRVVDELHHQLSYAGGNIPTTNYKSYSNIPHSSTTVNSSYIHEDKMNSSISIGEQDRYNARNDNEKGQDVVYGEDDRAGSTRSLVRPSTIPPLSPPSDPDHYASRYSGSGYHDNDDYHFPGHPEYQDQGWRIRRMDGGVKLSLNISEIPGYVAAENLTTGEARNPTSGDPVVKTPSGSLGQGPHARQGVELALKQRPGPGRPLGTRPLSGIHDTGLDFPRRPTSSTPPPAEAINPLSLLMSVRWTTPPSVTTTAAPGLSRRQVSQALTLLARLQDVLSREVVGATQLPPGSTAGESASPPSLPPLLYPPAGPTASFPSLEGYPEYPRPVPYPPPGGLYSQYRPLPPPGCLGGGASTSTSTGPGTAAAAAAAGGGGCGGGSTSTSTSVFGSVGSAAPGSSVSAGGGGPQGSVVTPPAPVGPPSPPVSLSISTDPSSSSSPPSPPSEEEEYVRVVSALNTILSFINRSQTQPEVSTSAPSSFRVSASVYVPILSELLRGPMTTTTTPPSTPAGFRPLARPAAPLVLPARTPQHEDLTDQSIQKLIQQGYTLG
ncbi:uncharacterized protein [Panulirus ornatus]|uniref:uncharacterized protein isoform X2 n=1 Tax=Panulirus ornatus TaxID=150431 RepID=UPI003A836CD2